MTKQMVKGRRQEDITGLNCIKGASGKVIKGSKTHGRSTWRN